MMLPRDLSRLVRTTAFKLLAVYLVIFALFAVSMIGYVAWHTRRLVESQVTENVDAEVRFLAEQYRLGGIQRLVLVIDGGRGGPAHPSIC